MRALRYKLIPHAFHKRGSPEFRLSETLRLLVRKPAKGRGVKRQLRATPLYLEIVRLAYNLVTAFQRTCLQSDWQSLTLQKLRFNLFLLPGEITRPQNRPVLRLKDSSSIQKTAHQILANIKKLKPLRT